MKTIQQLILAVIFGFITMNALAQKHKTAAGFGVAVLQTEPQFPGGLESLKAFIHDHIRYPEQLKQCREGAGVLLVFIIDTDGKIVDPKVLKGVNEDINEEALRVLGMMPDWEPGTTGGIPVNKQYILPIYLIPPTSFSACAAITQVL